MAGPAADVEEFISSELRECAASALTELVKVETRWQKT